MRAAASSGVRLAELVATISLGTDSHRSLKPLAAKPGWRQKAYENADRNFCCFPKCQASVTKKARHGHNDRALRGPRSVGAEAVVIHVRVVRRPQSSSGWQVAGDDQGLDLIHGLTSGFDGAGSCHAKRPDRLDPAVA